MKNLLTYDEIMRFALIASMVGTAFFVGVCTAWFILKGAITNTEDRLAVVTKQLQDILDDRG